MDYNIKNALYASVGVREYRIVDPGKERTTIYYYEQDAAPMIIPFHQEVIPFSVLTDWCGAGF